jgi:hypothetical protein
MDQEPPAPEAWERERTSAYVARKTAASLVYDRVLEISLMSEVPQARFWGPRGKPVRGLVVSDRRRPLLPAHVPDGDHALRKRE